MPLFMDFHIISDITVDEVKRAHVADLEVQDKYNVRYHQFWVNEEAGTLFCLIEGPDKESCEKVHKEAHGNIACQIVEVEKGFYKAVMGEAFQIDHGLVMHKDGKIDQAYRFVLVADIRGNTRAEGISDVKKLIMPDKPKELIRRIIPVYQGREIKNTDSVIAVFTEADQVTACAIEIQNELLNRIDTSEEDVWNITFKIGIGGGQPVTMQDEFFKKTIRLAQRLSLIAGNNEIVASNLVRKLSDLDEKLHKHKHLKFIQSPEEKFLEKFFDITEQKLSDHSFNIERLCRDIGISRPQLYRKITSATGRSPNSFIRDVKMKKALALIREKEFNVSEISMLVGYNNPSYFSRCFQDTYGITPSRYLSKNL